MLVKKRFIYSFFILIFFFFLYSFSVFLYESKYYGLLKNKLKEQKKDIISNKSEKSINNDNSIESNDNIILEESENNLSNENSIESNGSNEFSKDVIDEKLKNSILELMVKQFEKPVDANDFNSLRDREELHTELWHQMFGDTNGMSEKELYTYKENLIKNSSFLGEDNLDMLSGEKKVFSVLHKSLYSWLYDTYFENMSEILNSWNGKGIVICTGNKYFKYVRSSIDTIRNVLNCKLPIEVFYHGDEDLSLTNREILRGFENVSVINIKNIFNNSIVNIRGWAIKPYAILASHFDEVILMDADAIYIRNPEELFKSEGYLEKGTLFFRDRTMFPGPRPGLTWLLSWMIDPLPETKALRYYNQETGHEMESSTVVINKVKTLLGLLGVCKLNEKKIRDDVVYKMVYGDKETFWIGYDLARQPYFMSTEPCGYIGEVKNDESRLCGHIAHYLNGKLMFWNDHLVEDKNNDEGKNKILNFEAYAFDDDHSIWVSNFICLEITKTNRLTYFSEEEKNTLQQILDRETENGYITKSD